MRAEKISLQEKVKHLQAEADIIDWHIKFQLDGRTPKQILQGYYEARDKNVSYDQALSELQQKHSDLTKRSKA